MARLTRRERRSFLVGQFQPHAWRVRGTRVSAAADPRKDAVHSGVALVMRGGPPSTPQIEAKLGRHLVRAVGDQRFDPLTRERHIKGDYSASSG